MVCLRSFNFILFMIELRKDINGTVGRVAERFAPAVRVVGSILTFHAM